MPMDKSAYLSPTLWEITYYTYKVRVVAPNLLEAIKKSPVRAFPQEAYWLDGGWQKCQPEALVKAWNEAQTLSLIKSIEMPKEIAA